MSLAFPGRINRGGEGLPVAIAMHVTPPGDRIDHWRVEGVLSGAAFAATQRHMQVLRDDGRTRHLLWRGFTLRLDPLRSADYVLNLNHDTPRLFVVARFVAGSGLEPLQVTASLDEAQSLDATDLRDADEHVLGLPMPADIGQRVAAFTREHYQPPPRKGRRRQGPRDGQ